MMCLFSNRCKFWRHCLLYRSGDHYCDLTGGDYDIDPFEFRPVGCYRQFEEHGKDCKYWIKKHEKITSTKDI
jgi:hypothetical protein